MIYTPQDNPRQALTLILSIVFLGILAGYLVDELFIVIAIVFWMQYTLVLSYNQIKKGSKHKLDTFTNILLNAPIRLILFESSALAGLIAVIVYRQKHIGAIVLLVWLIFSINFYYHYTKRI